MWTPNRHVSQRRQSRHRYGTPGRQTHPVVSRRGLTGVHQGHLGEHSGQPPTWTTGRRSGSGSA